MVLLYLVRCYALEICDLSLDQVYMDPEKYRKLVPSQLEFMLQLPMEWIEMHP